jgi:hypothetical protein
VADRRTPAKKTAPRATPQKRARAVPGIPASNGGTTDALSAEDREWVAKQNEIAGVTTHQVQAAVEGVPDIDDDKVEFMGERFRVAESVGLMPLLKFAHVSAKGVDSGDMEGLAALYSMIRGCIDHKRPQREEVDDQGNVSYVDAGPSEWDRFERHAIDNDAEDTDLMPVVQRAMEVISARPTKRRTGSSPGRRQISANSKASSLQTDTDADDGMISIDQFMGR